MEPLGNTLVIRPGALGDAVLTLPALHALRLAGADSLTVLGTPASWGFIRNAREGLRVRDFSSSEWLGLFAAGARMGQAADAMIARTHSAVIYLRGETAHFERVLRDAGVKKILSIQAPVGAGNSVLSSSAAESDRHAARQLLDPLTAWISDGLREQALHETSGQEDVFLALDEHERNRALERLGLDAPPSPGLLAIHPGSGGRRKCWSPQSFAKLLFEISCRSSLTPLVFFGPADEQTRTEFEAAVPPGVHWECAADLPLRDVFALLTCCRGYVGNDSGVTHLAARACPTVAIFGPTESQIWGPIGKRVRVIRAPGGELSRLKMERVLSEVLALIAS